MQLAVGGQLLSQLTSRKQDPETHQEDDAQGDQSEAAHETTTGAAGARRRGCRHGSEYSV